MGWVLRPEALLILDRHYNSFMAYRAGTANLYAVRMGGSLVIRYADFLADRVVLRGHDPAFAAEVLEIEAQETANDLLVGRVAVVLNAL